MSQRVPNTEKGKIIHQWILDNTLQGDEDSPAGLAILNGPHDDATLFQKQLQDQYDSIKRGKPLDMLHHEMEEDEMEMWSTEDIKNVKTFTSTLWKKVPYYVPAIKWVRAYSRQDFIGDLLASITTAVMLVPQGLAYAILAGLPPLYGLYTGWIPLVIYAVMGSCKQLAIGPEALLAVLLGSLLDKYDEADAIRIAHLMALVVGVISLIFGSVRFGFMHNVISRWVLAGFINAVAFIIALSQLDTLLGLKFDKGLDPYEKFIFACENIKDTNKYTVSIAVVGISFLFGMRFFKKWLIKKGYKNAKYIPEVMMIVIFGIIFMKVSDWESNGVKILRDVPGDFPVPKMVELSLSEIQEMAGDCLLIVIVGFVEATAVSRSLATKHGYQISSNRELVAFGAMNIIGSFFQIYPCFASIPRTSIQDSAGSRTCLCGFLTSCFLLITILCLTPLFFYLPNVVMASIIFVAAFGLLEVHEAIFLYKTKSWSDLTQFVIACLATFILGVELGILISVGMCIFLVLKQASTPQVYSVLGRGEDGDLKDVSKYPDASPIEGVTFVCIEEVLTFANMGEFKLLLENLEKVIKETENSTQSIKGLAINMKNVSSVDASALLTFHEMVEAYKTRGMKTCFVEVNEKVLARFEIAGIKQLVGTDCFFSSNESALQYLERLPKRASSKAATPSPSTPASPLSSHSQNTISSMYPPSSPGVTPSYNKDQESP